jgi:luciferase family oxidoreductase group 1
MRVSILDIQTPIHLPDVVEVAEETGFHRYWVSEHHAPTQSASPTLATALAAGVSERLRVGMGGVLLRMHLPMRVAADIALLRAFFPGRIDVGIAGASYGDALSRALSGETAADSVKFRGRIEELIRLCSGNGEGTVACSALARDEAPQFWLCGTSLASASLAGALGLRYAYHHHLKPLPDAARRSVGVAYRDAFRPSAVTSAPYLAIAAYGTVASSEPKARDEWQRLPGGENDQPTFAGAGGTVAGQLSELVSGYGADEAFVDCFATSLGMRLDGLRSLADALRLSGPHTERLSLAARQA